ncbi:MAG: glutaredoxin family protein [Syntrophobacteraceae bacterium]|jgi:glutaredoxin
MAGRAKIYSTPGCNLCDQAKKYLSEKGGDFDLVDVTRAIEAFQQMQKLSGGARTAPVISICDKVFVGFKKKDIEEALSCLRDF